MSDSTAARPAPPAAPGQHRPGHGARHQDVLGPMFSFAFDIPKLRSPPTTKVGTSVALDFEDLRPPHFKQGSGLGRVEETPRLPPRTREGPRAHRSIPIHIPNPLGGQTNKHQSLQESQPEKGFGVHSVQVIQQHRAWHTGALSRYC